ncbi:hypothetical protein HN592_03910 [Candidatus Woesearchaeota archaeon]|jgi:hypothetical protein|nr:hypothetical protein [Candidatus Woesearchaeota archaeon]MBT4368359.1 hypothetical protein [Candidatus Woesearchaeota archaeon]MBT4712848.1 hypothetical protein [Candidatus Woesearchaeota archaeon]MBT6639760.1 hypothetical protein [Candidatus Woesearchaeota archaeon]MBT7133932.1 hypothetical protein [Candidatus Woesearchaeota archaeon]
MAFDGFLDWMNAIVAIILIIVGVLAFTNVSLPSWIIYVLGVVFIIGGLFAFFNSFLVFGNTNAFMGIVSLLLSLIILVMGINVFFAIPYVANVIAMSPIGITHYIVNIVVAVVLFIIAGASD